MFALATLLLIAATTSAAPTISPADTVTLFPAAANFGLDNLGAPAQSSTTAEPQVVDPNAAAALNAAGTNTETAGLFSLDNLGAGAAQSSTTAEPGTAVVADSSSASVPTFTATSKMTVTASSETPAVEDPATATNTDTGTETGTDTLTVVDATDNTGTVVDAADKISKPTAPATATDGSEQDADSIASANAERVQGFEDNTDITDEAASDSSSTAGALVGVVGILAVVVATVVAATLYKNRKDEPDSAFDVEDDNRGVQNPQYTTVEPDSTISNTVENTDFDFYTADTADQFDPRKPSQRFSAKAKANTANSLAQFGAMPVDATVYECNTDFPSTLDALTAGTPFDYAEHTYSAPQESIYASADASVEASAAQKEAWRTSIC